MGSREDGEGRLFRALTPNDAELWRANLDGSDGTEEVMAAKQPPLKPGELSVLVVSASDLAAGDQPVFGVFGAPSSDPYVTIQVKTGGSTQYDKTATITGTLNPTWNERPFIFHGAFNERWT